MQIIYDADDIDDDNDFDGDVNTLIAVMRIVTIMTILIMTAEHIFNFF